MTKAKVSLMSRPDSCFFTTLCFSMKHVWDTTIPTACTDGVKVMWNPDFFMGLADAEERIFLMLHEVLHTAYMHMFRTNGRDHKRWNIACDHVINLQLISRGFRMPTGDNAGHADPKYVGMSAEQVYDLLPEKCGDPKMEDLIPGEGTPEEQALIEGEIQDILVRAVMQSKMNGDKPGTIPGEIEIFLDKLLNPIIPWNRVLARFFQAFRKSDYSWRRPNRRHFPAHYLPSIRGTTLMDLAIFVDTSASVSDSDFLRMVTELHSLLKMCKPNKMTLGQFDTNLKSVDVIKSVNDLMQVKFTGRGGTKIEPVIQWANENKPQLLLVFSDGDFSFPAEKVQSTTVWLIHNNKGFSPAFGKTVHYEM